MKTIQYVENGKGGLEAEPIKSTQGLSLFNANGDVNSVSTGFKYAIDTMSFIKAQVSEQKFYEVPFAEFMPVKVGQGNWAENIYTNLTFSNGGTFASSIAQGGNNTKIASSDISLSKKSQAVRTFQNQITYNIPEIEQALQANNWDIVMAKERARKKMYDLGLQEVAFLGLPGDTEVTGLLTNADATINTSLITKPIYGMTAAEISTFVAGLISTYFTATNSTQMPTDFVMPYSDYIAMAGVLTAGTVGTYPVPLLSYLTDAFKIQTQNQGFRVRPLAYGDAARNSAFINVGTGKQAYALYNNAADTMQLEIPVEYTVTAANSLNNFSFQNVAYSRFSGLALFRNLEVLYFQY
jgi:hypothetical protein